MIIDMSHYVTQSANAASWARRRGASGNVCMSVITTSLSAFTELNVGYLIEEMTTRKSFVT
jgi:hypothetical protein